MKIDIRKSLAMKPKNEIATGIVGWSYMFGVSVLQLVAVSIACVGATLRWFGRGFMVFSGSLFQTGKHVKNKIEIEWEDGRNYHGADEL